MFTEQGYELASLTEVAGKAGVTRQAVLHHFASKEELLTSSYADLLPDALSAVVMAAVRGPEPGGRRTQRHEAALAVARSLIGPG